jgi:hypothetical protein
MAYMRFCTSQLAIYWGLPRKGQQQNKSLQTTIQPCHCEPFFFGEAISRLSGQLDRLGIASSQRTLLAMTNTTVLMQD